MKFPTKKVIHYITSPFTLGLVVTGGMTYLSVVYYERSQTVVKDEHSWVSFLQQLHEKTVDWRLTDRGETPGSDRVAILAVDEKAIEQEGRWPWPRDKQAMLVDKAIGYGAKSVSFDIVYSEEDQNSSAATLRRLRRNLVHKPESIAGTPAAAASEVATAIDQELAKDDGDKVFSDTIRKQADHLILGAFYEEYGVANPSYEYCSEALFARTREARYWAKETLPLTITDEASHEYTLPNEFKDHLQEYFTQIEVFSSQDWFESHKEVIPRITENLEDLAQALPPENYPGVATVWINNDVETAKTLLEAVRPDLANPQGIQLLFLRFGAAFTKKEAASLTGQLRDEDSKYCGKFLTPNDELLSLATYKKGANGSAADVEEAYKSLSWDAVWTSVVAARKPAAQSTLAQPETLPKAIAALEHGTLPNAVPNIIHWAVNTPLLAQPTKHTGYFNAKQDTDGTIRRSILVVRRGNSYAPSLALKTFLVDRGYSAAVQLGVESSGPQSTSSKILKELDIFDTKGDFVMKLPVDREGNLMINYAGSAKMFPHISAADILSDGPTMPISQQVRDAQSGKWSVKSVMVDKKAFLKDKALIFGATAIGVFDLRVTPFDENYPGVETHANVLSNLLVENDRVTKSGRSPASAPGFLKASPKEAHFMWIILIALGLLLSALLAYFGSVQGLGITVAFMGGVYAVDKFWLFSSGVVTAVIFPMFEIGGTFVTLTFYKYFTEERKKRELKGTFEKYVSPAIVAEVLADPSNIELGGKKMELTVMFSDVRGFTTISEKLDPRQLSDLLNSYLTPMTDLVFKNKGTLDKYMGDAIMSFWGAPIHFKDHAHHGCRCALQMIERLKELQAVYRAKGLPEIDIGIGLNTGEMSVGNMGSETVRSYTVMGDSVNLGSRLEGINKQYGTRIIISEFTQAAVRDKFSTREVDWVRVKGKSEPVRIFELLSEGAVPAPMRDVVQNFVDGFKLYHERKFSDAITLFENGLKAKPDDAVTQLYIERCQDYMAEPPPDDWDGVYNMKSK